MQYCMDIFINVPFFVPYLKFTERDAQGEVVSEAHHATHQGK